MVGQALRAVSGVVMAATVLLPSAPARAADGRIGINQTCAVNTGCGPSDTPGFPVTVPSGSYALTSNLVVTGSLDAISVNGPHAWIDLRGFTIQGPTSCTSPGPVCTPAGSGTGISAIGLSYTTVVNGTIRGFGFVGVSLGDHCRVENVLVSENEGYGLLGGDGCLIRRVRAVRNGISGISTGAHGVLVENLADGNGGAGLSNLRGSVFAGNTVDGNGADGIDGFQGGDVIHDNQARRNGGSGIRANIGSIIEGNTLTENAVRGLTLSQPAGYGFNVIRSDPNVPGSSTVNSGNHNLGNNLCNGSTSCP